MVSTIVGEPDTLAATEEAGRIRPSHTMRERGRLRTFESAGYLEVHSPVRFPSTFIVTESALSPFGVAFRTTEKLVPDTVPSTRVIA